MTSVRRMSSSHLCLLIPPVQPLVPACEVTACPWEKELPFGTVQTGKPPFALLPLPLQAVTKTLRTSVSSRMYHDMVIKTPTGTKQTN